MTNAAGYTLWAFKPSGATPAIDVKLSQISGASLDPKLAQGTRGRQRRGVSDGRLPADRGTTNAAGYTTWGFKAK